MKKLKKIKKSIFYILLIMVMTHVNINVYAKENYYRNENGVVLSKQEYDFISNMYWEGYQEYLTLDDYNEIKALNLFNKPIEKEIKEYVDYPLTRGTSVTSNLRTLTIAKACSDTCMISLVNKWNGNPTIKSYDVFGARVSGVSILDIRNALVSATNYAKSYNNPKVYNNGFGFSVLIPNAENIKTTITFVTTKGGRVYGSYQHSMQNTTETISKQYSIGVGGYGKVFLFTGVASSIYENSPGVDIEV